jgi:hypothetical protein
MPATFVTTAELRANLGIGSLYSDATVEEVCQTAEDLIGEYLWHNDAPVVGTALQDNVATLMLANPNAFVTGQQITVSACGTTFNGTYTITGTIPPSTPAIREAAMIIAVDIWQARQVSQTGGVGMDGISASPYRMGYQLINRVRGLIQPYSSPASLVG